MVRIVQTKNLGLTEREWKSIMSEALESYRNFQSRLKYIREFHFGQNSTEEDQILEEMDVVWTQLTEEERDLIRAEGPKRFWPDMGIEP